MSDTERKSSATVSRRNSFNKREAGTKKLQPVSSESIKILFLENISEKAVEIVKNAGYQVESVSRSLNEEELIEKIKDVHGIGIRSKTRLNSRVLAAADNLQVIGCFCIGTNQVDLEYAASRGISVFNSPFSNSRSVAELIIAEIIMLSRKLGDRNNEMHAGEWNKVSKKCHEIRGKTVGIIGYGHIGTQLSVLAESMGMKVIWYDVLPLMPLGRSKSVGSLEELLVKADYVTLHVPETSETKNLIGEDEIRMMKKGACLLNASRGTVVDIKALAQALRNGHLAGAAVDVFPQEPFENGKFFESELAGCPNTILTPHIGGSTEEAQRMIGIEVASAIVGYMNTGASLNAVNFPEIDLKPGAVSDKHRLRIVNVHQNVPGVLQKINSILSKYNVDKQASDSRGEIAYYVADITLPDPEDINVIYAGISGITENIITRVLFEK
ncbi:D-3-phosphoglycerate dehydrogenase 1 [Zancudomyces culisetae]|uniref:D-3-phosphoglycerate dehydrogenase 1 n=1 Tax=Zancudomyces culisetae TaxID=1213189 RepID=A0A1R1PPP1_ZANCU|nr:D-3-phosphoglycerate dehydrogenase 1 [Zancudomyces culisetae]|eukprot:OMH82934.1 D-3-phosphoglycerate dehydrogenase 1 [Zancudomyces culisetae]